MTRKKLPTVKTTILTIAMIMGVMVIVIWFGDISFPKLDQEYKRKFGQSGLLLTYCGALLMAYKIFWDRPFATASAEAKDTIKSAEATLKVIRKAEKQLSKTNLKSAKDVAVQKRTEGEKILQHTEQLPILVKFTAWVGIALIVAGTILQFFALG